MGADGFYLPCGSHQKDAQEGKCSRLSIFSSYNPRILVLQLDRAVDVAELASSGQAPRYGQVDEVAGVATVEGSGLLEVPVQDFRFKHFVFVLKGLLPDKGKLPVFVAVGGLQGDVAPAVSLGFPFQKAGTVVGVGMEGA